MAKAGIGETTGRRVEKGQNGNVNYGFGVPAKSRCGQTSALVMYAPCRLGLKKNNALDLVLISDITDSGIVISDLD